MKNKIMSVKYIGYAENIKANKSLHIHSDSNSLLNITSGDDVEGYFKFFDELLDKHIGGKIYQKCYCDCTEYEKGVKYDFHTHIFTIFIDYRDNNGNKVLYINYHGLNDDEILAFMTELTRKIRTKSHEAVWLFNKGYEGVYGVNDGGVYQISGVQYDEWD